MTWKIARSTLFSTADVRAWSDALSRFRHDFYHVPAYVAYCAAQEQGHAFAILIETEGGAVFVPFVVRDIVMNGVVVGRDAATPYGYPGPLVRCAAGVSPHTVIAAAA